MYWSISPSGRPPDPSDRPADDSSWPSDPSNSLSDPMDAGWMDRQMYGWTLRISPHSMGLRPLLGLQSCYPLRLQNIKEAGQGNQLLRDALWQLVAL